MLIRMVQDYKFESLRVMSWFSGCRTESFTCLSVPLKMKKLLAYGRCVFWDKIVPKFVCVLV